MLRVAELSFRYGRAEPPILRQASFEVQAGEVLSIVGENAEGKTTLAHILCGVIPYLTGGELSGDVFLGASRLADLPRSAAHRPVAYVPQSPETAFLGGSVEGELLLGARDDARQRPELLEVTRRFQLDHLLDRDVHELSMGEKQRVALACALLQRADLIILDEPYEHLDLPGRESLSGMLESCRADGKCVLVLACRDNDVPLVVDRVLRLAEGRLCELSTRPPEKPSVTGGFSHRAHERPGESALSVRDLFYRYPTMSRPCLEALDFDVTRGQVMGIVGNNGSGKTTLLLAAAGLLRPTRGGCYVGTRRVDRLPFAELARRVGILFQNPDHQLFASSVSEELAFGLRALHLQPEQARARIDAVSQILGGIGLERDPRTLSYGQRKLVSLACVVAMDPDIYLFDEPGHSLSSRSLAVVREIIERLISAGKGVIVASHLPDSLLALSDELRMLEAGREVLAGQTAEVSEQVRRRLAEPGEPIED